MKWLGDQKWKLIIRFEVSQVTTSKESMPKQYQMWQPSWSQKEMKWQQSTLCKLKLKKCILYLILSICMPLYQERCYIDCQQSLMLNKILNTQVRWVKHNGHTHSTSHCTRKNRMVRFSKPDGPVFLVKPDVPVLADRIYDSFQLFAVNLLSCASLITCSHTLLLHPTDAYE